MFGPDSPAAHEYEEPATSTAADTFEQANADTGNRRVAESDSNTDADPGALSAMAADQERDTTTTCMGDEEDRTAPLSEPTGTVLGGDTDQRGLSAAVGDSPALAAVADYDSDDDGALDGFGRIPQQRGNVEHILAARAGVDSLPPPATSGDVSCAPSMADPNTAALSVATSVARTTGDGNSIVAPGIATGAGPLFAEPHQIVGKVGAVAGAVATNQSVSSARAESASERQARLTELRTRKELLEKEIADRREELQRVEKEISALTHAQGQGSDDPKKTAAPAQGSRHRARSGGSSARAPAQLGERQGSEKRGHAAAIDPSSSDDGDDAIPVAERQGKRGRKGRKGTKRGKVETEDVEKEPQSPSISLVRELQNAERRRSGRTRNIVSYGDPHAHLSQAESSEDEPSRSARSSGRKPESGRVDALQSHQPTQPSPLAKDKGRPSAASNHAKKPAQADSGSPQRDTRKRGRETETSPQQKKRGRPPKKQQPAQHTSPSREQGAQERHRSPHRAGISSNNRQPDFSDPETSEDEASPRKRGRKPTREAETAPRQRSSSSSQKKSTATAKDAKEAKEEMHVSHKSGKEVSKTAVAKSSGAGQAKQRFSGKGKAKTPFADRLDKDMLKCVCV